MAPDSKDPRAVAYGHKGARTRWGEPKTLRLDDLTQAQRRLVQRLVDAVRADGAAGPDAPGDR